MNNLEIGELVYLENEREYVVVSIIQKDNYDYAYLTTTEEPYKIKFAKIIPVTDDVDLEIVNNQEEKEELLELFQKKLSETYL